MKEVIFRTELEREEVGVLISSRIGIVIERGKDDVSDELLFSQNKIQKQDIESEHESSQKFHPSDRLSSHYKQNLYCALHSDGDIHVNSPS